MAKNKIVIQLSGGIGNQIFQYVFGLLLSKKLNSELIFDATILNYFPQKNNNTLRKFKLDVFDLKLNIVGDENAWISTFTPNKYLNRLYILYIKLKYGLKTILQKNDSRPYDWLKYPSNSYIVGNFQSDLYFEQNEDPIRKQLEFKLKIPDSCKRLLNQIESNESVSVHIRRGDYLTPANQRIYKICDLDYYNKSLKIITNRIDKPLLIVFSDDNEFAKKYLNNSIYDVIFAEDLETDDTVLLLLMSKCKHHIIANSSFSWWGAWLNPNPNKIVISPERWFVSDENNYNFNYIIPTNWIKI